MPSVARSFREQHVANPSFSHLNLFDLLLCKCQTNDTLSSTLDECSMQHLRSLYNFEYLHMLFSRGTQIGWTSQVCEQRTLCKRSASHYLTNAAEQIRCKFQPKIHLSTICPIGQECAQAAQHLIRTISLYLRNFMDDTRLSRQHTVLEWKHVPVACP